MSYIDANLKGSNSSVSVKVPSSQGGMDRTIYVNGRNSGYRLGSGNNKVYNIYGREVASNLQDFIKLCYGWSSQKRVDFSPL